MYLNGRKRKVLAILRSDTHTRGKKYIFIENKRYVRRRSSLFPLLRRRSPESFRRPRFRSIVKGNERTSFRELFFIYSKERYFSSLVGARVRLKTHEGTQNGPVSVESKPSRATSSLKQRVVREDQVPSVGRVRQLVSSASHLIDQAFRLGFAVVRTPADRHYGYPGRLPGDRIQNLHKHDQREKKIFSSNGNDLR